VLESRSRSPFKAIRLIGAAALLLFIISGIASSVQAASYTYANAVTTQAGHERFSGLRSVVAGGTAQVNLTIGYNRIFTYYAPPGQRTLYSTKSDSGAPANMHHPDVTNAHSKCSWSMADGGPGTGDITCTVRY